MHQHDISRFWIVKVCVPSEGNNHHIKHWFVLTSHKDLVMSTLLGARKRSNFCGSSLNSFFFPPPISDVQTCFPFFFHTLNVTRQDRIVSTRLLRYACFVFDSSYIRKSNIKWSHFDHIIWKSDSQVERCSHALFHLLTISINKIRKMDCMSMLALEFEHYISQWYNGLNDTYYIKSIKPHPRLWHPWWCHALVCLLCEAACGAHRS